MADKIQCRRQDARLRRAWLPMAVLVPRPTHAQPTEVKQGRGEKLTRLC
jgi:hypothetical protein